MKNKEMYIADVVKEDYHNISYVGTGSTQTIKQSGLPPDFVWIKEDPRKNSVNEIIDNHKDEVIKYLREKYPEDFI